MGTPDRTPGPEYVEKLIFEDEGHTSDNPGELTYNFSTGSWELMDSEGKFDPKSANYRRHFFLMGG